MSVKSTRKDITKIISTNRLKIVKTNNITSVKIIRSGHGTG